MLRRRRRRPAVAVAVVHGHGEPDVEVLVEHLSAEGDPLAEHVHRHQAQRLPVHQEPLRVHRGQVVGAHQAADPPLHVLAEPSSRIWEEIRKVKHLALGRKWTKCHQF